MSEWDCESCEELRREHEGDTAVVDAYRSRAADAIRERDAAIARAEKAEVEQRFSWDLGAQAERSRDELGIQLAAQGERLRLAMSTIEAVRALRHGGVMPDHVARAMDAILVDIDAVPGDALPHGALASSGRLERAMADRDIAPGMYADRRGACPDCGVMQPKEGPSKARHHRDECPRQPALWGADHLEALGIDTDNVKGGE